MAVKKVMEKAVSACHGVTRRIQSQDGKDAWGRALPEYETMSRAQAEFDQQTQLYEFWSDTMNLEMQDLKRKYTMADLAAEFNSADDRAKKLKTLATKIEDNAVKIAKVLNARG